MAEGGTPFKPNSKVQIEGLRELRRELRNFDKDLSRNMRKEINKPVADLIAKRSQPWIPVKTGKLRNSITAMAAATYAGAGVKGSVVPYANFIHWGANGWPKRRGKAARQENRRRRRGKERQRSLADVDGGKRARNSVAGTLFIWKTIRKLTGDKGNREAIVLMEKGVQKALDDLEATVNRAS